MKAPVLALVLLAVGMRQDGEAKSGSIRGVVVDANGRPTAHVHVAAYGVSNIPPDMRGFAWAGVVPGAITGDDGAFVITGAPLAIQYLLSASSEEQNVPDLVSLVYTQPHYKSTFVDLLADGSSSPARVELPAAVGRLNGTVVDAHTGLPAHVRGQVRMRWLGTPSSQFHGVGFGEDGKFSMLIPDRRVFLEVSAEGCDPWHYVDPVTQEPALVLHSGQLREQIVALNCQSPR